MHRNARLVLLSLALCGVGGWALDSNLEGGLVGALRAPVEPPEPSVILVVLDTFRADMASVCGGDVPTPTLEALAQTQGSALSCWSYTPSPWTLPSHASYFTGVLPLDHGAHAWLDDEHPEGVVLTLDDSLPTLAEDFGARGFQTLALSANPVVGPETGLTRGFEQVRVAERYSMRGPAYAQALDQELETLHEDRPLFAFLNLIDAHSNWPAVPEGLDWVEAGPGVRDHEEPYYELSEAEWERAIHRRREAYRYALHQADHTLGLALERLEARGWYDPQRDRVVVITDHGEMLGEDRLLFHGAHTHQGNTRGLMLTLGMDVELPHPVSSVQAYHLLRDGQLGQVPVLAVSFARPKITRHTRGLVTGRWLSVWEGEEKWTWNEGQLSHRTLRPAGDPVPLNDAGPLTPHVEELLAHRPLLQDMEPRLQDMLRAAGYIE